MRINKEKAKRCYVKQKTIKEAIAELEKLLDYFELHNKNLTGEQFDRILNARDILYCIDTD